MLSLSYFRRQVPLNYKQKYGSLLLTAFKLKMLHIVQFNLFVSLLYELSSSGMHSNPHLQFKLAFLKRKMSKNPYGVWCGDASGPHGCSGVVPMNLEMVPSFGNLGELMCAGEAAGAQLHGPH